MTFQSHGARSGGCGGWPMVGFFAKRVLHCEGGVTGCIVMVQNPFFFAVNRMIFIRRFRISVQNAECTIPRLPRYN
jgi:hypothetical protein